MPSLYEISIEAEVMLARLEESTDVEERVIFEAFLDGLRTEAELKADGYAKAIREYESRAEARRAEAKRLVELGQADENRAARLKRFLVWAFDALGVDRVKGQLFTLRVQKNGGKAPLDVHAPITDIPQRFLRQTWSVNGDALREALEKDDPEAKAVACLMDRGRSIRIG